MADSQASAQSQSYASKIIAKFGSNGKITIPQMTTFYDKWLAAEKKLPATSGAQQEIQNEQPYTEAQTAQVMSYFDENQDKVLDQQELAVWAETMLGLGSGDLTGLDNALSS